MCHIILRVPHLKENTEPIGVTNLKSFKKSTPAPKRITQISAGSVTKRIWASGKDTFKLKLRFLTLGTLCVLILPISTTQDMSDKALQCAEVQRAICKVVLL